MAIRTNVGNENIPDLGNLVPKEDRVTVLEEDLTQIARVLKELATRQQQIIQALTQFQLDVNNLGKVSANLQKQIDVINRRHKNQAKRGGYKLDEAEEPDDTK